MAGKQRHSLILRKYTVLETIGQGGFGKVKKAISRATCEMVAIKIIDKSRIGNVEDVERFTREFAILNALEHKNVINLHEVLQDDQYFFVIMDLCEGNLADLISRDGHQPSNEEPEGMEWGTNLPAKASERRVATEEGARVYFRQMVAAVEHAHKKNIFHRDIKLENVLVDLGGALRLCDFGLSAMPDDPNATLKTSVGTLHYTAPEVLRGKGYQGSMIDIWSLGVALYVMTVGKYPFAPCGGGGNTRLKEKHSIQNDSLQCPCRISSPLQDLLTKILEKDPAMRISLSGVQNHPWFQGMDGLQHIPYAVKVFDIRMDMPDPFPDAQFLADPLGENFRSYKVSSRTKDIGGDSLKRKMGATYARRHSTSHCDGLTTMGWMRASNQAEMAHFGISSGFLNPAGAHSRRVVVSPGGSQAGRMRSASLNNPVQNTSPSPLRRNSDRKGASDFARNCKDDLRRTVTHGKEVSQHTKEEKFNGFDETGARSKRLSMDEGGGRIRIRRREVSRQVGQERINGGEDRGANQKWLSMGKGSATVGARRSATFNMGDKNGVSFGYAEAGAVEHGRVRCASQYWPVKQKVGPSASSPPASAHKFERSLPDERFRPMTARKRLVRVTSPVRPMTARCRQDAGGGFYL